MAKTESGFIFEVLLQQKVSKP